jgi:hypothetical protein
MDQASLGRTYCLRPGRQQWRHRPAGGGKHDWRDEVFRRPCREQFRLAGELSDVTLTAALLVAALAKPETLTPYALEARSPDGHYVLKADVKYVKAGAGFFSLSQWALAKDGKQVWKHSDSHRPEGIYATNTGITYVVLAGQRENSTWSPRPKTVFDGVVGFDLKGKEVAFWGFGSLPAIKVRHLAGNLQTTNVNSFALDRKHPVIKDEKQAVSLQLNLLTDETVKRDKTGYVYRLSKSSGAWKADKTSIVKN